MTFAKIYIVGGLGIMGKLLHERINRFYHLGTQIIIFDKGDIISIPNGTADGYNLVIVSTPISEIGPTLDKIAKINPKFTMVTEIGSVKGGLWADYIKTMAKTNSTLFFGSTHNMVGPLAKDWDVLDWKKKCLIINGSGKDESSICHGWIVDFWKDMGFITEVIDPLRHDEIIGLLSHLSHYMIMMYVRHVRKTLTPAELALAGTSFETFVKMADGAERLNDIYDANKSLPKLVESFCKDMVFNEKEIPKVSWYAR